MSDNSYDYSKQDGYYGSKEDYYDADGIAIILFVIVSLKIKGWKIRI